MAVTQKFLQALRDLFSASLHRLEKNTKMKSSHYHASRCSVLLSLFLSDPEILKTVLAAEEDVMAVPGLAQVLVNISQTVPELIRLVTAFSYVYGTYVIVSNVAGLRNCAHTGQPFQGQHTLTELITKILLGAMLIYLPSTIQMGTSTFWINALPIAYVVRYKPGIRATPPHKLCPN